MNVINFIGWLLLVLGAFKFYSDCVFFAKATRCTGRFKGWYEGNAPTVVFTTTEGKEIEFTSKVGYDGVPRLKIGDPIEVLYDPARPENARVRFFWLFFLMVALCSVIVGLCFVLFVKS